MDSELQDAFDQEIARRELDELIAQRSGPAPAPQPAGFDPEIARRADIAEQAGGTNSFADATGAGGGGIPFGDEIASLLGALPSAAISAVQGKGFHPVDEYNSSQAVQTELARRREERSPTASKVGEVAAGLGVGGMTVKSGLSLLNGAQATAKSLIGRGMAEGGIYGALYGGGEGEGLAERGYNALFGAGLGATVGGGTGAFASRGLTKAAQKAAPSIDELRAAGQAAYEAADQAGVAFTPAAVQRLNTSVTTKLADMGYDPALQPGAAAVVRRIGDLEGQNITLKGLDTLRKVASNGFVPGNQSNNKAVGQIIREIDDLIASPGASDVLMGDAKAGSDALSTARQMWSRVSKSERVAEALAKAELRASSTGSGGNVDNATRQNLRRLVEKPRGFSPEEVAALEKAVRGTPSQNALRLAGKLSPSGNGLMAALGVGGAMVNPAIGVASLGGMGAKAIADGLTTKNVAIAQAMIRNGGKLPAQLSGPRKAIVEALTRASAQQLPYYTGQ